MLMDALVHAWTNVTQGMKIPRERVSPEHRAELERVVNFAERTFMKARDRVRECSTFRQLVPGDQKRIAAIIFELYPPTG